MRDPSPRLPAAQRRAQIIDAAIPEFAARGYDGVSMEALARAAGVDKVILYRQFGGIGPLFEAAYAEASSRVLKLVLSGTGVAGSDEERVRAMLTNLLKGVRKDPSPWLMLSVAPSDPKVAKAVNDMRKQLAASMREAVISVTAQEERDLDHRELVWFADLVYGGLVLALRQHLQSNPAREDRHFVEFLVSMFTLFRDGTRTAVRKLRSDSTATRAAQSKKLIAPKRQSKERVARRR
jgi:AcrR family transcriptional regulator